MFLLFSSSVRAGIGPMDLGGLGSAGSPRNPRQPLQAGGLNTLHTQNSLHPPWSAALCGLRELCTGHPHGGSGAGNPEVAVNGFIGNL